MRYSTTGMLDTSFSNDGVVSTDISNSNDEGKSLVIQPNGKIVLGGITTKNGNANFSIARYNANGTPDSTFSGDGKLFTAVGTGYDEGKSVALQPDGKILIAGQTDNGANNDFAVVRYDSLGNLDNSFGGKGIVTTDFGGQNDEGNCIRLQPNGKILVAGYSYNGTNNDFAIVRYLSNGSLDPSFGTNGKKTISIGSGSDIAFTMAIQADGKIVLAGISHNGLNNDFAVVRLDSTGATDNSFDFDGKQTAGIGALDDDCKTVTLQSDGKILLGGVSYSGTNKDFALIRYNTDGSIDNTFDTDGRLTTDFANTPDDAFSMVVQPADGKIVLCGETQNATLDFAVARYTRSMTTELAEIFKPDQISVLVYPNPLHHTVTIKFSELRTSFVSLLIYNSLGQSVYSQQLTSEETTLQLNLQNGIYDYYLFDHTNRTIANGKLAVQ